MSKARLIKLLQKLRYEHGHTLRLQRGYFETEVDKDRFEQAALEFEKTAVQLRKAIEKIDDDLLDRIRKLIKENKVKKTAGDK